MATKKVKKDKYEGLTERQIHIIQLREKLNAPDKDAVNVFTKYKITTYIFNIVFPPYALYRIWCKKSEFNGREKMIQTLVCVVYVYCLIKIMLGVM